MLTRRPIHILDASLLHKLFLDSPNYFKSISATHPTLQEVSTDIVYALHDERRRLELLFLDLECVGYLDYKFDYPKKGDTTINLVLIPDHLRGRGYGRAAVHALELELQGRYDQLLAGVYAADRSSEQFWVRLGYHFAKDARPLMFWYAKSLKNTPDLLASDLTLETLEPSGFSERAALK